MAGDVEWRHLAVLGLAGLVQTMFEWGPAGPWDSPSFTRGCIGILGGVMLYMAWFRWKFRIRGLVPTIDRMDNPEQSWKQVLSIGFTITICGFITGRITDLPAPSGLILSLVGGLMILNGIYVGLVVSGPLGEEE